ncbi:hypothetical protein [Arsukibacterium indicum]|uniref:DnaT DNA-binding domain-containing protein n=1 Tax=Arsukibacterium indicum TaxID=2848612 RepID=A0ABS6MGL8_9GAMM|nr:hypothetical protein [Arsukibacterium indicum]MBV2127944.1 hypothetical protein [Arsukibacterium indicum]
MARSRNIKPALFLNDDLAERNCPLGRLLFIGLWTLADYKGELEWRAGKIKAQLLPYDECDIKQLAINLDKSGFIRFYSDGDKVLLNIPNFEKHQNPHKNEKAGGSDIPPYTETMRQAIDLTTLTINRDLSGLIPEQDGTAPADSLLLIPDSLIPDPSKDIRTAEADAAKPERAKAAKDLDYSKWPSMPSDQVMKDWITLRKDKKMRVTQTVVDQFADQLKLASQAGFTVDECLALAIKKGWAGFEYEWMVNARASPSKRTSKPHSFEDQNYQPGVL